MSGTALFVENDGEVTARRDLPPVTARDKEILIDVIYSGVNPADLKVVHFINYRNSVPGTDFCGKVLDCPALVDSGFKVGDIVAGQTVPHGEHSKEYGSHKPRISTPQVGLFKVPENMAHSDAAAITTVSHTASDALYNNFRLPLPGSSLDVVEGTLVSVIKAGHSRVWGFETAGSPESSQLLLDALSGIAGDVHYSWVNAAGAQRPPTEAVLGTRDYEIVFEVPSGRHVIPAEAEKAANMWAALDWAVKNYGKGFELPVVRVFEGTGEKALEEMETVSKQGAFGKLVLKHPLQ
ncbi:hypothetical protein CSAL01_09457 [Colletotrichum salicis]|uniref:Enoyl reductase (ER) domain-containing protein n=1 Tax=Colletotrichum salicis TaxID=1209931 RepID=A0A135UT75_9PEZI|nr:hypothetical protein CSAL01_09457 [Colletotrichum salicis]